MQKSRINPKHEPTKIKPILEENLVKSFENVSINSSYTTQTTYHEEEEDNFDDDDVILKHHIHDVDLYSEDENNEDGSSDEVASTVPNTYDEENHIFHFHFIEAEPSSTKKTNGGRKNFSFSNEKVREIERTNRILLQKILSKGPIGVVPKQKKISFPKVVQSRGSSAEVNRRRQQKQIDTDNELLRKKIEKIYRRKSAV